MLRQYGASRWRCSKPMRPVEVTEGRGKKKRVVTHYVPEPDDFGARYRVGTIPIGTIVYLQDRYDFRYRSPVLRNPWMVVAWLNRQYFPCSKGKPPVTYLRGGHLALVKSLRTGEERTVSDHWLLKCEDMGLTK